MIEKPATVLYLTIYFSETLAQQEEENSKFCGWIIRQCISELIVAWHLPGVHQLIEVRSLI